MQHLKHINLWIFSVLFVLLLTTCNSNDDELPPVVQDDVLKVYMDRFEEEAAARGIDISLEEVDAVFVDRITAGDEFCGFGYTNFQGTGRRRVEIVNNDLCWNSLSEVGKEILMFHEIGHAVLNRPHLETQYPNRLFESLMCVTCNLTRLYTPYTYHRREYYLDELLDQSAPAPFWSASKSNFQLAWDSDDTNHAGWRFSTESSVISGDFNVSSQINGRLSLRIFAAEADPENRAFWQRSLPPPVIPNHADLQFEVTLKTRRTLVGPGLALSIRTDALTGAGEIDNIASFSTEGNLIIDGDLETQTFRIQLPDYSSSARFITFQVTLLPGTTGEVFIDDMRLLVAED